MADQQQLMNTFFNLKDLVCLLKFVKNKPFGQCVEVVGIFQKNDLAEIAKTYIENHSDENFMGCRFIKMTSLGLLLQKNEEVSSRRTSTSESSEYINILQSYCQQIDDEPLTTEIEIPEVPTQIV